MNAHIYNARINIRAALTRFAHTMKSERGGLNTSELALLLVAVAIAAIVLANAIQSNVEANVANIPDHSDLP